MQPELQKPVRRTTIECKNSKIVVVVMKVLASLWFHSFNIFHFYILLNVLRNSATDGYVYFCRMRVSVQQHVEVLRRCAGVELIIVCCRCAEG